jgi:sugar lactone lactonase YvrE
MESERTRVVERFNGSLRGITFSPDFKTLYVANRENASLHGMNVRPDGTVENARVITRNLGSSPDGLATDICGNIYVADRTGDPLVRVTPTGQVEEVVDMGTPLSSLAFGSGKQGWDERSLYAVSEGRAAVFEIRLGVRGPLPPAPVPVD